MRQLLFMLFFCFCRFGFYGFRAAFMRGMVLPYDPQGRINADGRIGPADEADEHDQGKVLRRIAAEEV